MLLQDSASFTGTAEAARRLQRKHPSNKPCSGQYMSERSSRQLWRKPNFYFLQIRLIKSTQKRFSVTNFPPDTDRTELWRAENRKSSVK
ncbi:uncharacterized [Tachysurus ichikawai]